jgi:hypothetical protein
MVKVTRIGIVESTKPTTKKSLWRKIAEKLMFWQSAYKQATEHRFELSDLWQPSTVLEKDLVMRRERIEHSMREDAFLVPEEAKLSLARRETKRLQKAAKHLTKLAVQGKIPLEQALPLAFPELKEWKFITPPKTQGLKPFVHVDVPDEAIAELTEKLDEFNEVAGLWSHALKQLCTAVAGAALFLEQGGTDEDALTILSCSCGPMFKEAFEFSKVLRLTLPSTRRYELARFAGRTAVDPRWVEKERYHKELRALYEAKEKQCV